MFRPARRFPTLLLLIALALLAAWPTPAEAAGPADAAWWQPWDLASRLWSAFIALWGDHGCSPDPNGVCGGGPQPESGCTVDPDGRCIDGTAGAVAAVAQSGCSLDPSGRCVEPGGATAADDDHGCSVDPNGGCGH